MTKAEMLALSLAKRKSLYSKAKQAYYNSEDGKAILTDAMFDLLEESIRVEEPKWSGLKATGVKVGKKVEADLDVPCASLEKILHDNPKAFERWKTAVSRLHSHAHLSRKLDGSSLQGTWIKGTLTRLRTRGDGVKGKDISYFIPYVSLPKTLVGVPDKLVIRFEAVIKRSVYEKKWAKHFESARALSSAVFNRQDVHEALKDVDLVALKVQHPVMAPAVGSTFLCKHYFVTPVGGRVPLEKLTLEKLTSYTVNSKQDSEYDMDGVVIQSGSEDPNHFVDTEDRPKLAKAFKVNTEVEEAIETVIVGMVIKASSFGVLVPKAVIKPVKIGDVTVTNAAVYNFKWAIDRGADIGATVKVIRGGDIIPKIVAVTKPVKFKSYPSKQKFGEYDWDETKTNLVLVEKDSKAVIAQKFLRYFNKLKMADTGIALATKLADAGYTSTAELVSLSLYEISCLPGIKDSAKKLYGQLSRVSKGEYTIVDLMAASCVFDKGVGSTKLEAVYRHNPALMTSKIPTVAKERQRFIKELEAEVATIKGNGCGPVFAKLYASKYVEFQDWRKEAGYPEVCKPSNLKKPSGAGGTLSGEVVTMTGYRDAEEVAALEAAGAVVDKFSAKTTILLHRPTGKRSTKLDKAANAGMRVCEFKDLKL